MFSSPDVRLFWLLNLTIRQYLVASHLERRALRGICLYAMERSPGMDVAGLGEVVPGDICALADAYVRLLESFNHEDEGDLNILAILHQYVSSMLHRDDSTQTRFWDILKPSMDLLWLVCSKTRNTPRIPRTSIWLYSSLLFASTRWVN